jgi:hypothetical protein
MSIHSGLSTGHYCMNSWFWYKFMVCLMGPILANIADNLVKIDYGMLPMMLGSGIAVASI